MKFALWRLEEYGIPTGLALTWLGAELITIYNTYTVGHQLGLRPVLGTLGLSTHPDADIGVALLGTTKVGRHKVALFRLDDAGGVAFREVGLFIQKLVANNLLATLRQFALKVVNARAYLLETARQMNVRCRVGWYLHMPVEASVLFLPTTHNLAVDAVIAGINIVNLINGEVGCHLDVTEAQIADADASDVLIEPRQQVAQQHHVVAAVHLRRRRITIPEFPDGGSAMFSHIAPRGILLVRSQEPRQISTFHQAEAVQEPARANDTRSDGAEVLVDKGLDNLFFNFVLQIQRSILLTGNHSEHVG